MHRENPLNPPVPAGQNPPPAATRRDPMHGENPPNPTNSPSAWLRLRNTWLRATLPCLFYETLRAPSGQTARSPARQARRTAKHPGKPAPKSRPGQPAPQIPAKTPCTYSPRGQTACSLARQPPASQPPTTEHPAKPAPKSPPDQPAAKSQPKPHAPIRPGHRATTRARQPTHRSPQQQPAGRLQHRPPLRRPYPSRQPMPLPRHAEWPLPDAWRPQHRSAHFGRPQPPARRHHETRRLRHLRRPPLQGPQRPVLPPLAPHRAQRHARDPRPDPPLRPPGPRPGRPPGSAPPRPNPDPPQPQTRPALGETPCTVKTRNKIRDFSRPLQDGPPAGRGSGQTSRAGDANRPNRQPAPNQYPQPRHAAPAAPPRHSSAQPRGETAHATWNHPRAHPPRTNPNHRHRHAAGTAASRRNTQPRLPSTSSSVGNRPPAFFE